jgi:hypothetical protein
MALTLFVPKHSSMQIERSVEKSGWLVTFLPLTFEYLFAFAYAFSFFWVGHLAGYFLRRSLLSNNEIDIYSSQFMFRYLVGFSLIPMLLLIILQILVILVLRDNPVGFLEFVISMFIFTLVCSAIVFLLGFLSLRSLRGFAKRHIDVTSLKGGAVE